MDRKVIASVFLFCNLFFFLSNKVEGYDRLLTQEDVKLEEELKRLNKPGVKTIYTKYGDIYDCVDFYKQPAFDDPLLKNHNFHPGMKPSMIPTRLMEEKNVQSPKHIKLGLEDGGCPFGTVPIRRTTKDDLIRAKWYQNMFDSRITPKDATTGHYQAIVRHDTPNHGAGAEYNIYNLPVAANQYTSGQVKIVNKDESLIAGWTVNPGAYGGDTRTHMFVYLNANGRSCFNTQCGFVQVSQQVPVDTVIEPVSTFGGDQYGETFFISQDPGDSNWYYKIRPNQTVVVGFWPKSFVTKLGGGALAVEWGGEAFSPPGTPPPGMGTGERGEPDTTRTAFASHCKVVINNNIVDPPLRAEDAVAIADSKYYAMDFGTQERDGRLIIYGGPGH